MYMVLNCRQLRLGGISMAVEVREYDEQWQRAAGQSFTLQDTVFVPHDFAISENYYIFSHSATSFDMVRTDCHCKLAGMTLMHASPQ